MEREEFERFLKRSGRSPNAALRAIGYVQQFESYLSGVALADAEPADLESFVAHVESAPGANAKLHLWGIRYYYEFLDDVVMVHVAGEMRRDRVEKTAFRLAGFRGVSLGHTDRLAALGVRSVDDLREAASTPSARAALAAKASIPLEALEELVRLADLARVNGLKGIRARLYLDAGVRSIADLATRQPDELLATLRRFVDDTGFDGIAPLPGEVRHAVVTAQGLPALIEWESGT